MAYASTYASEKQMCNSIKSQYLGGFRTASEGPAPTELDVGR